MEINRLWSIPILSLLLLAFPAMAEMECEDVEGRVKSKLVEPPATFSNGDACTSPLGLCTEGRFSGDLRGKFRFIAASLTPFDVLDPTAPPDVAATTGSIEIRTRFCKGRLVLKDTSTFSLSADGFVASIQTVDGDASTRGCADASGRLRLEGVFMDGCVDCRYKGEVCAVEDDDYSY